MPIQGGILPIGKNVFSHPLTWAKMCGSIEGSIFRASLNGTHFFYFILEGNMKTSYRFFIVFLILFTIIFNSIGCSNEQKSDPSSLNDAVDMEALDKSNEAQKNPSNNKGNGTVYILNTDSKKIHYSSCSAAKRISIKNRRETTDSISSLVANGYTECGICMK